MRPQTMSGGCARRRLNTASLPHAWPPAGHRSRAKSLTVRAHQTYQSAPWSASRSAPHRHGLRHRRQGRLQETVQVRSMRSSTSAIYARGSPIWLSWTLPASSDAAGGATVKIIIETCYLTDAQKVEAGLIVERKRCRLHQDVDRLWPCRGTAGGHSPAEAGGARDKAQSVRWHPHPRAGHGVRRGWRFAHRHERRPGDCERLTSGRKTLTI